MSQEMLFLLVKEVVALVKKYSNGSSAWIIYDGVGAWEVLYGYMENVALQGWLNGLSGDAHYQVYLDFILLWNATYPWPYLGEGRK